MVFDTTFVWPDTGGTVPRGAVHLPAPEWTGELARVLAEEFRRIGLFDISPDPVKINMFYVRFKNHNRGLETNLVKSLKTQNILTYSPEQGWIRFVTHHDMSLKEVEQACREIEPIVEHTIKRTI